MLFHRNLPQEFVSEIGEVFVVNWKSLNGSSALYQPKVIYFPYFFFWPLPIAFSGAHTLLYIGLQLLGIICHIFVCIVYADTVLVCWHKNTSCWIDMYIYMQTGIHLFFCEQFLTLSPGSCPHAFTLLEVLKTLCITQLHNSMCRLCRLVRFTQEHSVMYVHMHEYVSVQTIFAFCGSSNTLHVYIYIYIFISFLQRLWNSWEKHFTLWSQQWYCPSARCCNFVM